MDLKNLISRIELAASLGVEPQTIAKWQRLEARPRRAPSSRRVKRVRRRDRLFGFTYDEAASVAHFSMYLPGRGVTESVQQFVRARTTRRYGCGRSSGPCRGRHHATVARGADVPRVHHRLLPSIEASLSEKTARDYLWAIERHLLPQLGPLRLDEITSGY
jgi:hypothetical protein